MRFSLANKKNYITEKGIDSRRNLNRKRKWRSKKKENLKNKFMTEKIDDLLLNEEFECIRKE
jgi:hypothetical protein